VDEDSNMKNGVGIQMMDLNTIIVKKTTEKKSKVGRVRPRSMKC
jgi:hypothetical protein